MLVGDIKLDKVKVGIFTALAIVICTGLYGIAKANEYCSGGENNNLIILLQYQSMNPLSAEIFKLQCRELNRGY